MPQQTRGLGRGLGALIPQAGHGGEPDAGSAATPGILEVPVGDIVPNPRQPRGRVTPESLAELAASIREHGVLQPLIVTRGSPTDRVPYQLIAGERRWRAAQLAGLTTVPIIVKEATSRQLLELALVENIQRADLNALEEAEAYQALIQDFKLSQHEVASRVGRSRVAVTNALRLLHLPEPVKALLLHGELTEGHARALLGLNDESLMVRAAEQVTSAGLNVRQTEELVRRLLASSQPAGADETEDAAAADPYTRRLEDAFRGALGTKVALTRGKRGGRLVISFYSDEELQTIYERIVGNE